MDTIETSAELRDEMRRENRRLRARVAELESELRETGKRRDWYAAEATEAKGKLVAAETKLATVREWANGNVHYGDYSTAKIAYSASAAARRLAAKEVCAILDAEGGE